LPAGIIVPAFPQRSPPRRLTAAACGGLGSAPDCRTRRALLAVWTGLTRVTRPSSDMGLRDLLRRKILAEARSVVGHSETSSLSRVDSVRGSRRRAVDGTRGDGRPIKLGQRRSLRSNQMNSAKVLEKHGTPTLSDFLAAECQTAERRRKRKQRWQRLQGKLISP
jgi:hypothetical protein